MAELLQGTIAACSAARSGCSAKERARLLDLLLESKGVLTRLTPKERKELRRLLGKLDLGGLSPRALRPRSGTGASAALAGAGALR